MAGAGKKTFTAGEVLTASDVNTYLMEQSVMVFGGTAARSSAIPTPSEGMVSYRADADNLELYNGSSWIGVGGLQLIETKDLAGLSSVSFNNVFSADYDHYRIIINISLATATADIQCRLRSSGTDNTTANYAHNRFETGVTYTTSVATGQTSARIGRCLGGNSITSIDLAPPFKSIQKHATSITTLGVSGIITTIDSCALNLTTPFDGITFFTSTGSITTGTASVYGYRK
jgi:hypothetical protein